MILAASESFHGYCLSNVCWLALASPNVERLPRSVVLSLPIISTLLSGASRAENGSMAAPIGEASGPSCPDTISGVTMPTALVYDVLLPGLRVEVLPC
jgi:hypothetical protein